VEETLDRLKSIPKAILSNKSSMFTRTQLEAFHIDRYFIEVISGDSFLQMKPSPEPIYYLLEKYSIEAQRVLMIGDYIVDIKAGKAAGVKTCAAFYGFRPREEVLQYEADFTIEQISDLLSIVFSDANQLK
jgi:phosphoglycolate phosphatase